MSSITLIFPAKSFLLVTRLSLFLFNIAWLWGRLSLCFSQSRTGNWFNKVLFPIHTLTLLPLLLCFSPKLKKKKSSQTRSAYEHWEKIFNTNLKYVGASRIWRKTQFYDSRTSWALFTFPSLFLFFSNRDYPVKNYQMHHPQFQQITSVSSKIPFDWPLIGKSSASLLKWICNHLVTQIQPLF